MLNWLKNVLGLATNVIDETIRRWVSDLISGIFGFLHTVFGLVGNAWADMFHAAEWLYGGILHLGNEVYETLWHILRKVLPDIVRWLDRFINDVWHYAQDVFHWAMQEFARIEHWVLALIDDVRRWVINDIWEPIWDTLAPAWTWITHEGLSLWNLVMHPGDLVDWIWNHILLKIEREAWNAARFLGRFFLSLIVHNIKTVAVLFEDILDAIL